MRTALILTTLIGWLTNLTPAVGCTVFAIQSGQRFLVGRNYDWQVENAYILINQRQTPKRAYIGADARAAQWVSRYGSLTFNQYGKEMPTSGINEQGLSIDILWLDEADYPASRHQRVINEMQWVQYQLDSYATVAEVISHLNELAIERLASAIHYFVADASGQSAAIEFINGKPFVYTNVEQPVAVLANDSYPGSLGYLKTEKPAFSNAFHSLNRFRCAAQALTRFSAIEPQWLIDSTFSLLQRVAQGAQTKWSLVYDYAHQQLHYRTYSQPQIRTIDLASLHYEKAGPVRAIPLNGPPKRELTYADFSPYTADINQRLLTESSRIVNVPAALVADMSAFQMAPESRKATSINSLGGAINYKNQLATQVRTYPDSLPLRWRLMQYYLQAPAIAGGSKSAALAEAGAIKSRNPLYGFLALEQYYLRTKDAEKAQEAYAEYAREGSNGPHTVIRLRASPRAVVQVAGAFTDWQPLPMYWQDGNWCRLVRLEAGSYPYKFIVDGNWQIDPSNANAVKTPEGYTNSVLTIR